MKFVPQGRKVRSMYEASGCQRSRAMLFSAPARAASNFVLKRCHVGALGARAISRAALVRQVGWLLTRSD